MSADLKVVQLRESNFRDPAAMLREIAEAIDAGEYGDVGCVGIALLWDTLEVFGAGPDSEGPSVAMVLHGGFLSLSESMLRHGRE